MGKPTAQAKKVYWLFWVWFYDTQLKTAPIQNKLHFDTQSENRSLIINCALLSFFAVIFVFLVVSLFFFILLTFLSISFIFDFFLFFPFVIFLIHLFLIVVFFTVFAVDERERVC